MKSINTLAVSSLIFIATARLQCNAFSSPILHIATERKHYNKRASLRLPMSQYYRPSVDCVAPDVIDLRGSVIVVKYGGNAMTSPALAESFCEDVAELQMLGAKIIIVHGDGPQINAMLSIVDVESKFSESGIRVSTPEVVNVAEMVLCGSVNKLIASNICNAGGKAIGLSGRDNQIMQCVQMGSRDEIGYVGSVDTINVEFLEQLLDIDVVPVISPIGCGKAENNEQEVVYNVNADMAACRLAGAVGADQVVIFTDIAGVLDKNQRLLRDLTLHEVDALIRDRTITEYMIPQVQNAVEAVMDGVEFAKITDGRLEHALLHQIIHHDGSGGTTIRY